MPSPSQILRLLLLAVAMLGNCVGIARQGAPPPAAAAPSPAGSSLDEAAAACLDWAWSLERTREAAGGVVFDERGELSCTSLTLGTRNTVQYEMAPDWLAQFHTHTLPGRSSGQDRDTVAHLDPLGRPGYVREPSGVVRVYECHPGPTQRDCRERTVFR